MAYSGSVKLISGITQKAGDFPLVHAKDVYTDDTHRQSDLNVSFENRLGVLEEAFGEGMPSSQALHVFEAIGNDYVTPEDYGAVGDGVHDDAAALQAALYTGKWVVLTKDLYCKTPVNIKNASFYLDGRDHKIVFDYTGREVGWGYNYTFSGAVSPLPEGQTSNYYIRTGGEYIRVWDEWRVDFTHPFDPRDPTRDTMKFGYISYDGVIPADAWMVKRLDEDPDATIAYYPTYQFKVHNTHFRYRNCRGVFGLNFDYFVNSELINVSSVCETDNNGDGKCGIRFAGCSGVTLDMIYTEGWCDRTTFDYMGEYGYGIACPSDNVSITRYVGKNSRDHLAGGGSNFSHWASRLRVLNCVFFSDGAYKPNRPGWWGTATAFAYWDGFETHGNQFSALFDNIIMSKIHLTVEEGSDGEHLFTPLMEFRHPHIRITNIELQGIGFITFLPEYLEYIHVDNVYAPDCDLRIYAGSNMWKAFRAKEVLLTNSLFRRTDECLGHTMVHLVNCWIIERLWALSWLKMEGCTLWADLDWGIMSSIEAKAGIMMSNCDIYANASFYTPATTAVVKCPENMAMVSNCRFYLLPGNTVFNNPQRDLSNVVCTSRYGCRLRSNYSTLGECYPFPANEEGMFNLWEGHAWRGDE